MIFNADDFTYNEAANAKLASKAANEKALKDGKVVYGNVFNDGQRTILTNFTGEQKSEDTHIGVIMGLSTMGSLPIIEAKIDKDEITQRDLDRAYVESLEAENRKLKLGAK